MRCDICDIAVTGEKNYREHLNGKKHMFKMHMLKKEQKDQPYQISRARGTSFDSESTIVTKDGTQPITPGESATLGYEDVANRPCQIQPELDALKSTPLLGLEYLVEASPEDMTKKLEYYCLLCDKMGAKDTVIKHLMAFNHQLNYLKQFFPSVHSYLEKVSEDPDSKALSSTIMVGIAKKVEAQFGRLKPLAVEKKHFVGRKRYYFEKICRAAHPRETSGMNLKEVMDVSHLPGKKQVEEPVVHNPRSKHVEKAVQDTLGSKHIEKPLSDTKKGKRFEKLMVDTSSRKCVEKESVDTMGIKHVGKREVDTMGRKHVEKQVVDFSSRKSVEKPGTDISGSKCVEKPEIEILGSKHVKNVVVDTMSRKCAEKEGVGTQESKDIRKPTADIPISKCVDILASISVKKPAVVTLGSKSVEKPTADILGTKSVENRIVDTVGSKDAGKPGVDSLGSKHVGKSVTDTSGSKGVEKLVVNTQGCKRVEKPEVALESKCVTKPMPDTLGTKSIEKGKVAIGVSKDVRKSVVGTPGAKHIEKPLTETLPSKCVEKSEVVALVHKCVTKPMPDTLGTKSIEKGKVDIVICKDVRTPVVGTSGAKHVEKPLAETLPSKLVEKPEDITLDGKCITKPMADTLGTKSIEKGKVETLVSQDLMKHAADTICSKHLEKPVLYTPGIKRVVSPEIEILGSKCVKKEAVDIQSSKTVKKPVADLTVSSGNKLAEKPIETYDLTDESTQGAAQQVSLFHKSRFSMDKSKLRKSLRCDDSLVSKSLSEKESPQGDVRTKRRLKEEDDRQEFDKRRKISLNCRVNEYVKREEENKNERTVLSRLTSVSPVSSRSWSRSLSRSPDNANKRSKPLYRRSLHYKSHKSSIRSPRKCFGKTKYRSRSPIGKFSMDSRSRGDDRYAPYEKQRHNERDKKTVWEVFRQEAGVIDKDIDEERKHYIEYPKRHPTYASEWDKFCIWKVDSRKDDRGINPRSNELQEEWAGYWINWMNKYYSLKVENKKNSVRKRLGLPEDRSQNVVPQKHEKLPLKAAETQVDVPSHSGKTKEEKTVTVTDMRIAWKALTGSEMESFPEMNEKRVSQTTWKGEVKEEVGNNPGLIDTLRLITALEDQLGSLGPKVNALLSQALALQRQGSIANKLLQNSDNIIFFETVKEKFLGHLHAGIVRRSLVDAVKHAVETISYLLKDYSLPKEQKISDVCVVPKYELIPISPRPVRNTDYVEMIGSRAPAQVGVSGRGGLDTVAQRIAQTLVEQGQTDLSEQDLRNLVSHVVEMAQTKGESKHQAGMSRVPSRLSAPGVGTFVSKGINVGPSTGSQSSFCSRVAPDPRFELARSRLVGNTPLRQYVDQMRATTNYTRPPLLQVPLHLSGYTSWQAPFASSHVPNTAAVFPMSNNRSGGNSQFAGLYCDDRSMRQNLANSLQNSHGSRPSGATLNYPMNQINTGYRGFPS